jgi:hypothetical protein
LGKRTEHLTDNESGGWSINARRMGLEGIVSKRLDAPLERGIAAGDR